MSSFIRVVLHRKDKEPLTVVHQLSPDTPDEILDNQLTVSLGNEIAGSAAVTVPFDILTMMIQRVVAVAETKKPGLIMPNHEIVKPH